MQAVIMAGGKGVRLRPMTCNLPKPMVPVLGRPVMEYSLHLLKKHGVKRAVATVQYLPEAISRYFGDGSPWGVRLEYAQEDTPLGTAGSVKNAMDGINEPFFVLSGDALTDIDLTRAMAFHREKQAAVTIVLKKVPDPVRFGVVITDEDSRVVRFQEKPEWDEVFSDTVNTGIYILNPDVMRRVPPGKPYDFSQHLFPELLRENVPIFGWVADGYWCDIGSPEQYREAQEDFLAGRVRLPVAAQEREPGVFVEDDVVLSSLAVLEAPCYVCRGAVLQDHVYVGEGCVVGEGCHLDRGASLKKTILWGGVIVGEGAELRGAILCDQTKVGREARIFEGAIIGTRTALGDRVTIHAGVQLWPDKVIEAHDIVEHNVIWSHADKIKNLVGGHMEGWLDRDISMEFMVSLAGALALFYGPGSRVALGSWGDDAAGAMVRTMSSQLALAGVNCALYDQEPAYMLRSAIRENRGGGGIHIAVKGGRWTMGLYGETGCPLSRNESRQVENLLGKSYDFAMQWDRIGEIIHVVATRRNYLALLERPEGSKLSPLTLVCDEEDLAGYCARQLRVGGYEINLHSGTRVFPELDGRPAVRIADGGDTLIFRDERGRIWPEGRLPDLQAALVLALSPDQAQALPVSPLFPQALARKLGADQAQPPETAEPTGWLRALAAQTGNIDQLTAFDGPTLIVTLDRVLSAWNVTLEQFLDKMPGGYISQKSVYVPWEARGTVMRNLLGETQGQPQGRGGVRIRRDDGWVFIAPDPASPRLHLFAEGQDAEFADSLIDLYSGKIKEYLSQ